jgi:tape measure domain-containing protein
VKLDDAISPGARSASGALGALSKKLDEVRKRSSSALTLDKMTKVGGLDSAIPKLGLFARAVQAAGNAFGAKGANAVMAAGRAFDFLGQKAGALRGVLSGLAGVGKMALAAVATLGAVGIGLGIAGARYVIEAQAFKQSTMFAFKNLLGSQEAAQGAWERAKATSLQTGMGLQETAAALNQLVAVGFKLPQADTLIKQMADLKTLNPSANLEGIARAIGQIKNTGKLQGDELMQLADAGLSTEAVYKQLEKQTGKTRAEILKMQAAGQITSEMAIKAIQDSMSEQTGKAPGELAAEATRKTLTGAFGKLMAVKDAFVDNLSFDFTPISAFLDRVSTVLSGDAGKALGGAFEDLFNTVIGLLDGLDEKDIASFFTNLAAAIRGTAAVIRFTAGVVGALGAAWDWIGEVRAELGALSGFLGGLLSANVAILQTIGQSIVGAILGPIYTIGTAVYDALVQIGNIDLSGVAGTLTGKGSSLGMAFVQGILASLTGGLGAVFSAASALGNAMNSGTATSTQTASPSKTARRLGGWFVDGYIAPARKRLGEVYAAGAGLGNAANRGLGSKGPDGMDVGGGGGGGASSRLVEMFPQMFADRRTPAESAAMPVASAASIGTAAANVTNATTTNTRGDINVSLTANNADEQKMRAMITSTLRSLSL